MKNLRKVVSIIILVAFGLTSVLPPARASQMPWMPTPGSMVPLSSAFMPAILKGITIHPEDPLKFDFIIHRGDENLTNDQKQEVYQKLIKYFLASLAVPDENQWVNLSPYEKDRLIEEDFGKTEMGRDLLAQDYLLKQLTSSLMFPESEIGKAFWDNIYKEAQQKFGTTDIPVDTFNKVWIVPNDALIYEKGQTAYVLKNHLKVMLEEDYAAMEHNSLKASQGNIVDKTKELSETSQKVLREIIIPAIEKEVNEGKNFAALRQVYSGMLLAAWYKRNLQETLLAKIYANKSKVKGVDQEDSQKNQEIYNQYVDAFKKGVYNLIKEEYDPKTKSVIPRKYFSGGTKGYDQAIIAKTKTLHPDNAMAVQNVMPSSDVVFIGLNNVPYGQTSENIKDFAMLTGKNLDELYEMKLLKDKEYNLFLNSLRYVQGRQSKDGFILALTIDSVFNFRMLIEKNPNIFRDLQAKGVSKDSLNKLIGWLDMFKPLKLNRKNLLGKLFPKSMTYRHRVQLANKFVKDNQGLIIQSSTLDESYNQLVNKIIQWKGIAGLAEESKEIAAKAITPFVDLGEIPEGYKVERLNYQKGKEDLNNLFKIAFSVDNAMTVNEQVGNILSSVGLSRDLLDNQKITIEAIDAFVSMINDPAVVRNVSQEKKKKAINDLNKIKQELINQAASQLNQASDAQKIDLAMTVMMDPTVSYAVRYLLNVWGFEEDKINAFLDFLRNTRNLSTEERMRAFEEPQIKEWKKEDLDKLTRIQSSRIYDPNKNRSSLGAIFLPLAIPFVELAASYPSLEGQIISGVFAGVLTLIGAKGVGNFIAKITGSDVVSLEEKDAEELALAFLDYMKDKSYTPKDKTTEEDMSGAWLVEELMKWLKNGENALAGLTENGYLLEWLVAKGYITEKQKSQVINEKINIRDEVRDFSLKLILNYFRLEKNEAGQYAVKSSNGDIQKAFDETLNEIKEREDRIEKVNEASNAIEKLLSAYFSNPENEKKSILIRSFENVYNSRILSIADPQELANFMRNSIEKVLEGYNQNKEDSNLVWGKAEEDVLDRLRAIANDLDSAMIGKETPVGGIDFNAANLNMQIKRDGNGMVLPLDQQDLENIRIDGLIPIILDIKPAVGVVNLL